MSWLSELLGLDAMHNAGIAQQQANQEQAQAGQYRNQAEGLYGGLTSQGQALTGQGQAQYNQYSSLINSLLPQYEGAAGINGVPGVGTTPTTSAFALNPDEQQQLNSQIDVINQQHQAAQQAYQQQAAQRGFIDPAATMAQNEIIAQHFNQAVNDHTAQFHENARQSRLNALNTLLGFGANEQAGGVGQQQAGLGVQSGAASGVAGLGGQAQEASGQQATMSANLAKAGAQQLGDFAQLATYLATKGTKKGSGSTDTTDNSGGGTNSGGPTYQQNGSMGPGYYNPDGSPAIFGPATPGAIAGRPTPGIAPGPTTSSNNPPIDFGSPGPAGSLTPNPAPSMIMPQPSYFMSPPIAGGGQGDAFDNLQFNLAGGT